MGTCLALGCIDLILALIYGLDFVGIIIGILFIYCGCLIALESFLKNKQNSPLGEISTSWYVFGFIACFLLGSYFVFNITIGMYYLPLHQFLFPFSPYGLAFGFVLIGFLKGFFVSQDPKKLSKLKQGQVKLQSWALTAASSGIIAFFWGYVSRTLLDHANEPLGFFFLVLSIMTFIITAALVLYIAWVDILRTRKEAKKQAI